MKKIIELIPNTKVEINTDKNGKSVILYSDNNEEKESKFKLASDSEIQKLKDALKNDGYYWDEEKKEIMKIGKFNKGDYVVFKIEKQIYKGIIISIRRDVYTYYDIFVPLEDTNYRLVYKGRCSHPTVMDVEELNKQMLKIGKKWDGENIVYIIWTPKNGENYYYINAEGEICGDKYDGVMKWIDKQRFEFGNCFKTGEEAVLYRDKIKELLTNRNK